MAKPTKPSLSDEIRQLLGPVAHNQMIHDMGGRLVYIPAGCGLHHPLAEVLGHENALKLCARFAGSYYDVPLTQRTRERIIADIKANVSTPVIAGRYYCSRRTIFRIKAELAQLPDIRQGSLF